MEELKGWQTIVETSKATSDDLIHSYNIIMEMYMLWFNKSIELEEYESSAVIKNAILFEQKYYIRLGKDLFNKNLTKQIKNKENGTKKTI